MSLGKQARAVEHDIFGALIRTLAGVLACRLVLLAIQALQIWALRFRRVSLRIMLWLLGVADVFGVLSVLTASYHVVGQIAGTAALTAFAAGFLWPFSNLIDRDSSRNVGLFGTASVIAIYLPLGSSEA
jgi:hypothetical protein